MNSKGNKIIEKYVDNNGVVTIYPMDDIKVKFISDEDVTKYRNVVWKYFEDENEMWWGEHTESRNGKILVHGFYANSHPIGMFTNYDDKEYFKKQVRFYSFENPGYFIDENEYKRQLAKIRFGILKVPALDLKICDYE